MGATVDWAAVLWLLFELGTPAALLLLAIVLAAVRWDRRRRAPLHRRAAAAEEAAIARAREVLSGRPQR